MLQGDSLQRTALLKEKKGEFAAMRPEPDCDARWTKHIGVGVGNLREKLGKSTLFRSSSN